MPGTFTKFIIAYKSGVIQPLNQNVTALSPYFFFDQLLLGLKSRPEQLYPMIVDKTDANSSKIRT